MNIGMYLLAGLLLLALAISLGTAGWCLIRSVWLSLSRHYSIKAAGWFIWLFTTLLVSGLCLLLPLIPDGPKYLEDIPRLLYGTWVAICAFTWCTLIWDSKVRIVPKVISPSATVGRPHGRFRRWWVGRQLVRSESRAQHLQERVQLTLGRLEEELQFNAQLTQALENTDQPPELVPADLKPPPKPRRRRKKAE